MSALGERYQPAVVRAAVTRVAAETDVDATISEGEAGTLLDEQRVLGRAGIGVHGDLQRAGERVEPNELVVDVVHRILDRRDGVDAEFNTNECGRGGKIDIVGVTEFADRVDGELLHEISAVGDAGDESCAGNFEMTKR